MTRQHITATSAEDANKLLNDAVEELQHRARDQGGPGILVTRTGPGQFSIELSENVPYGVTFEAVA